MSFAAEAKAIEVYFDSQWDSNTYPVSFENTSEPDVLTPWVRLTFLRGLSEQADLGTESPLHFYNGVLTLQIFTPADTGTRKAFEIADLFSDLFRGKTLSTESGGVITFYTPETRAVVTDEGRGGWYQHNTTVRYLRKEIQSHAA